MSHLATRSALVCGIAAALFSLACSHYSTAPFAEGSAASSGPTAGSASISGTVLGPVSASDTSQFAPVANVTIQPFLVKSVSGDSLPPTVATSTTSDAAGRFVIQHVEDGDYTLAVIPPAGSPFAETGGFVQVRGGGTEIELHLVRLR